MSPPSEILAVLRLAGWQQSPTSEHIGQTQCLAALHSRSTWSERGMARVRIGRKGQKHEQEPNTVR